MFIETYIALVLLALLVPYAIWLHTSRTWNENVDSIEAQIAEDTCDKHGVFCCEDCFDMSIVS